MAKPYVCCRTDSGDYLGDDEHPVNQQAQENRMLTPREIECLRASQFRGHYPVLAEMLRFHELSPLLTQQHYYVCAQDGATYGIEMSVQRPRSNRRCCDNWAGDPRVLAVTPRLAIAVSNGSKIEMQSCR